ncbi:hypothetical protein H6504_00470 [Candidatus Woesearchaeota archaeon]|nr:hypothetical protein [Candidatus Woesearchaeota archaeon]
MKHKIKRVEQIDRLALIRDLIGQPAIFHLASEPGREMEILAIETIPIKEKSKPRKEVSYIG